MMLTLADHWESYRKMLPRTAGPTQITETRRAYYAGATAFYALLMQSSMESSDTDLSEGEAHIETIATELKDFSKRIGKDGY